jgi:hypothetical protein
MKGSIGRRGKLALAVILTLAVIHLEESNSLETYTHESKNLQNTSKLTNKTK